MQELLPGWPDGTPKERFIIWNAPPKLEHPREIKAVQIGQRFSLLLTASDPEGDLPLSVYGNITWYDPNDVKFDPVPIVSSWVYNNNEEMEIHSLQKFDYSYNGTFAFARFNVYDSKGISGSFEYYVDLFFVDNPTVIALLNSNQTHHEVM